MKNHRVIKSFNNDESNRCVDIIEQPDGLCRFQHWRREPEDLSGWILLMDSTPAVFANEQVANEAARQEVAWFDNEKH